MITRDDVLRQAVDQCMKELYSYAVPHVEWDDFMQENKDYLKKKKEYDSLKDKPDFFGYLGPRPFEFYYLPAEILKDICNNYVHAYQIDSQKNLLNIISILKEYCRKPIIDKYIDDWEDEYGHHPGYRSYDHPDNLEKEIDKIIDDEDISQLICNTFFKFLDMAGNFYNWNRDLNSFNMSVYLGASPNSNKEAVIENWKKYRNKDIEIDEEQIKKEYYGDYDE